MTASLQSVEDVVNAALDVIGYDRRVGDIFEGTRASKVALDLYGETRDALLRKMRPGFANRDVTLTALKTAPAGGYSVGTPWTNAYPPPSWQYEYPYPSDCLEVLYLQSTQNPIPNNNPLPQRFKIYNDQAENPVVRTILSNLSPAVLIYTGQVTDMTTWDASFVDLMVAALAKKFTVALVKNQQLVESVLKATGGEETTSISDAAMSEES